MAEMKGTFKGDGMVLTITPEVKSYGDLVNGMGQINGGAVGLTSFFTRATAEGTGTATLKRGDVEINLKYDFGKNIVTLVDTTGVRILFCYMFDKLFMLDPAGELVTVLSR